MHPGNIIASAIVIFVVSCVVYREHRWRYRIRNWKLTKGGVIGYRRPDDSDMMIVEYFVHEQRLIVPPNRTIDRTVDQRADQPVIFRH